MPSFQKAGLKSSELTAVTLNKVTQLNDTQSLWFQNRSYQLGNSTLSQVTRVKPKHEYRRPYQWSADNVIHHGNRSKKKPASVHICPAELEV